MPRNFGRSRREVLKRTVEPVDVTRVSGLGGLLTAFQRTSIQARNLGRCLEVWENALTDRKRPTIFLGLSGPLIAAGLRKVLRDLIDWGLVDVVVSTGAVLYQDIYQTIGGRHFMGTPTADDVKLRDLAIDRIYDTYVDELKFEQTDRAIGKLTDQFPARPASSREYLQFLGSRFDDPASIVATAARRGVPVFSPALIDSSIGIGLTLHYQARRRAKARFMLDAVRDNFELVQILTHSPRTAVIYIGGGTPKNWINDGIVMANYAFGREGEGHYYALQVTTDVPHWGGLSGSTLDEAQSWGKISRTATRAMAHVEASVALPLLAGALWERRSVWKSRPRLRFDWRGDEVEIAKVRGSAARSSG
ncbi:MAG TPA: deoxyhypusine synthase family protein [Thermoplasmata archaeon]|nr:deoxyhypusine synthase family protein [Thermoplasmata archaeon]